MDLMELISNVGFPIAVAAWFMITGKTSQDNLTAAVNNNTTTMARLIDRLDCGEVGKPDGAL